MASTRGRELVLPVGERADIQNAVESRTVRWYKFKYDRNLVPGQFELLDKLDLKQVPLFGGKETEKLAAQALGLKTWKYVRI
uniref:hypothetical protein n=1 Tax=Cupriavidus ulmosensis TaxID=3065913 RepID=UPI00296AC178|nr:hypothetical protein [Cupriavidus sp. CV2]